MIITGSIFSIVCLAILVIQDFRFRKISPVFMFLIPLSFCPLLLSYIEIEVWVSQTIRNLGFVCLILTFLSIYSQIRFGSFLGFIDKALGKGDILFFLVLCFLFSFSNFILFFLFSLIVSLLGFCIWALISRISLATAGFPLVSGMGFCLLVLLGVRLSIGLDFFYSSIIPESVF